MLDTLLEIAATPDWISPTLALVQTFLNRPSVGFNVPAGTEWSTYTIEDLLTGVGIKVWGLTLVNDTIIFRVRQAQARYTHYMLERAGVPYYGGLNEASSSRELQSKAVNKTQAPTRGLLDHCLDSINNFTNNL